MTALILVLLSHRLMPIANEGDLAIRYHVATAVLDVTSDKQEQALLIVIAAEESAFRPDVLSCETRGDNGRARGAWQIHPRSAPEYRAACTLDGGAFLALERVRESLRVCRHMPADKRLGIYNSGRCDRGLRISARRWRFATEVW